MIMPWLPMWWLGAPLLLAVFDLIRTPRAVRDHSTFAASGGAHRTATLR